MHRASIQYLFTNIKDTHLTIGLDSIFSKIIFNCEIKLLKKAIIAIKDTFINNPILVACVMTNYLHKVLPPQYSHVNKVYCLLAATVFCALPLCSTEAAAENILKYSGTTNIHGDAKTWAAKDEYDGIDIRVTGVDPGYYTETTEALVLNNRSLNVKGKGKFVSIINTAQNERIDNNGGIYAKGGSTVNFTDVDSIYIAAIAGKEGGNDSTVISAKDPGRDLKGYTNIVNISGTTVQLIGSIDVMHSLGSVFFNRNARHTVNAALSGSDSFWYGSAIGETDERTTVNLSLADGATWIFNAGKSTLFDHLLDKSIGRILGFASARHVRAPLYGGERITGLHKNLDTLYWRITEITMKDIPRLKFAASRDLAASSKWIWIGSPTTANGNTPRRVTSSPSAQQKTAHTKSLNSTWAKLIWMK